MSAPAFTVALRDEAQTCALAAGLAALLPAGSELHLIGPLAAGKTAFARGFLRALGHSGTVKSPTFTIVETYDLARDGQPLQVHHFDLYRLADEEELDYLGFDDYLRPDAILLIEWPSRAPGRLAPTITVELAITGPASRTATVTLDAARCQEQVTAFANLFSTINQIG